MTTVYPYVEDINRYYFCKKGNNHVQQSLNTVCLDPICRQNPLICSTCVSEYHKYHKTTPLKVFLSDYQGAIRKNNLTQTKKRIGTEYENIKTNLFRFKTNIFEKIDNYVERVEQYFIFLEKSLHFRDQLSRTLKITLDPTILSKKTSSDSQLSQSVSFIISNSLFNEQNRLMNISSILKFDQSRNLALLDKVLNENAKYQMQIEKCFEKLNFVKETLAKQSIQLKKKINSFNSKQILIEQSLSNPTINTDAKKFVKNQQFLQTLNFNPKQLINVKQEKQDYLETLFSLQKETALIYTNLNPIFQFHERQKHQMLNIVDEKDRKSIIKSNITALKPQYAAMCPSLDYQPLKQLNWSIKIINCRNFASKNTLAVGICPLNSLQNSNFEEDSTQQRKGYMITSQGYIQKNGREEKTEFRFSAGDTVHLKYDPFYRLLIIHKDNGRKITIRLNEQAEEESLYGCVRLTYASDQVQILNHIQEKK